MEIKVLKNSRQLGMEAGSAGAQIINNVIRKNGTANIILATGTSQFETLKQLVAEKEIDWSKVTMFHLDEYIGLPVTAKASFRKYLKERFLDKVPALKAHHLINGEADAEAECERLSSLISAHPVDVALVGVGENGHLAFNDPPADFDTEKPYLIVNLDHKCREQQLGEGWFDSLEEVPTQAISMSVKQIMKSNVIICSVPGARKAQAVKDCLVKPVDNRYPASILKLHPNCMYYLDEASASLLSQDMIATVTN
jgi:glucosamine-6-phosphate deaminase